MTKETLSNPFLNLLKEENLRKTWHNNEWWFAIKDLIDLLTTTANPTDYIKKMRVKDPILSQKWADLVIQLPVETRGGKQNLPCTNAEGLFRIVQSIPSPRAEPFKKWLAKTAYLHVLELKDASVTAP